MNCPPLSKGRASITRNAWRLVDRGLLLLLAGVLLLFIAAQLAMTYAGRSSPRPALQRSPDVDAIAGWMTLGYIARAYGVPEQPLLAAVQLSAPEARRQSLRSIARAQHRPPEQVIAAVRAAVLADRGQPVPAPPAASPTVPRARPPGSG
jgi:hypothetical protein